MKSTDISGEWSFLRSRRWLAYWSLLLVFSIVCVVLGNWQFQRRAEAQAEITRIENNYDAPPVPLTEVLTNVANFDEDSFKWLPVEVSGTYLADEQLLVRNRPLASGVGFEILTPLLLPNGNVFIVNRGWIPLGPSGAVPAVIPPPPNGEVRVLARLKAGEPLIAGRTASEDAVGTINLPQIEDLLDRSTYIGAYGVLISESPAADTGLAAPPPERDEGPHLSYALQWYVFIIIAAAGTLYGARLEHRSLFPNSKIVRASDERIRRRKQRRGVTDAEDEDAYLDAQERSRRDNQTTTRAQ